MAKTGYDFYLGKCLLPVTPSKLTTKINNGNDTVKLINEGEINLPKLAELTDFDFECDLPQVKQPYAVYKSGFQGADYFLNQFEELKSSMKPFQFIVCRRKPDGKKLFNTNIKVTLEDYKIVEDAKEGFDVKVKVSLKQWKDWGTKTIKISISSQKPKAAPEPVRPPSPAAPTPSASQTYTVVRGDCLWNIAKKFYGSGAKYTVIYNANKGVIGGNPNLIYPGQVLTIPAA